MFRSRRVWLPVPAFSNDFFPDAGVAVFWDRAAAIATRGDPLAYGAGRRLGLLRELD